MIPVFMNIRHDPPGSFGDCFRACVASVLEVQDVPHFYFDGPTPEEARERLRKYLRELHSLEPYLIGFPGVTPLEELLSGIESDNPGCKYILVCSVVGFGEHAVIAGDGKILHDPFYWPTTHNYEPIEGAWTVIIFVPTVLYAPMSDL